MSSAPADTCPACGTLLSADCCEGLCPQCVAAALSAEMTAESQTPPDAPHVPGWILTQPCGAGGQGVVWRAIREEDDEPGAVKIFRSGTAAQEARVEEEAAILTKLEHPGIVRVLDAGRLPDGRLYIVTGFIEGCDLARLLRTGKFTPERALESARQIAAALAHAHAGGVVHRDLKPSNVMDAGDGTLRLLDFSFASAARDRLDAFTASGSAFGTPYYMAPERIAAGTAGPAADVYALGVMLYEMLTGTPPLGRYARASEKCPVPAETDTLIDAMLAENPAARPAAQEAEERIAQLQHLLGRSDVRRRRRQRLGVTAAAAAIAAVAWAIGYFTPRRTAEMEIPAKNARGFPNPAAATRSEPWRNSLGREFLPVPGHRGLLMAKYESRMDDWKAYETARNAPDAAAWKEEGSDVLQRIRAPMTILTAEGWVRVKAQGGWPDPGFTPPPNAPAYAINYPMAQRFCAWLTWREQREGRLSRADYYRLPTDVEWSAAAGLPEEAGLTPHERHMALPPGEPRYPWGDALPPPPGFANYAGLEVRGAPWPLTAGHLLTVDAFPRLAPAGSFPPNAAGFHDLWGNVAEWCEDRASPTDLDAVLRGSSWAEGGDADKLRRDYRRERTAGIRDTTMGFRCVLVFAPAR